MDTETLLAHAYAQGLADYEAALLAQAGGGGVDQATLEAAYLQGLADYELALHAQAELEAHVAAAHQSELLASLGAGGDTHEAAYLQGLVDYETALHAHAELDAHLAAGGDSHDAAYLQGLSDYETALLQHAEAAGAQDGSDEETEAYHIGILHAEAEALAEHLSQHVTDLPSELRDAYDRGRSEYQAALDAQSGTGDEEPVGGQDEDES
jgi:hypothetical protein